MVQLDLNQKELYLLVHYIEKINNYGDTVEIKFFDHMNTLDINKIAQALNLEDFNAFYNRGTNCLIVSKK